MSTSVHLFDIASSLPGSRQSWSPNTLKTRIALNYKQIPYTQTYVSYPDIKPILLTLDVPPNPNGGQATYCLPAIALTDSDSDSPSSSPPRALNQSKDIADELERLFPARSLFPSGATSRALALLTETVLYDLRTSGSVYPLILPHIPSILDSRGQAYFKRTRKPEALIAPAPGSKDETDALKKLDDGMKVFLEILQQREGRTGPFLEGDGQTFGYADVTLVAFMAWFERGHKEIWERMMGLGGGELRKLWDASCEWVEGQGTDKEWNWEGKGAKPEHEGE